jgi:phage tail-like protein
MALGERKDPYLGCRFLIEVDGLILGGFSEASGLQAETETEDYREGGVNDYVHKLPKITKYPNITLKRGLTDSDVLWKWYRDVVSGTVERRSGRIVLIDSTGGETWHWVFEGAYPVKWTGPDFKADGSAVAIEALELVHNGIRKG